MGLTNQVIRETPLPTGGPLDEIQRTVARARDGSLTEAEAFEAIARIAGRQSSTGKTYQKPWG